MRKVCLSSLGAIAGAAVTLVTSESRTVIEGSSAKAAAAVGRRSRDCGNPRKRECHQIRDRCCLESGCPCSEAELWIAGR
jgi:hypothetical protein